MKSVTMYICDERRSGQGQSGKRPKSEVEWQKADQRGEVENNVKGQKKAEAEGGVMCRRLGIMSGSISQHELLQTGRIEWTLIWPLIPLIKSGRHSHHCCATSFTCMKPI